MLIILLTFNLFAAETYLKFCSNNLSQLKQKISFVFTPKDNLNYQGNCGHVVTNSERVDLISKIIKMNDPSAQISSSQDYVSQKKCKVDIITFSGGPSTNIELTKSKGFVNSVDQRSKKTTRIVASEKGRTTFSTADQEVSLICDKVTKTGINIQLEINAPKFFYEGEWYQANLFSISQFVPFDSGISIFEQFTNDKTSDIGGSIANKSYDLKIYLKKNKIKNQTWLYPRR